MENTNKWRPVVFTLFLINCISIVAFFLLVLLKGNAFLDPYKEYVFPSYTIFLWGASFLAFLTPLVLIYRSEIKNDYTSPSSDRKLPLLGGAFFLLFIATLTIGNYLLSNEGKALVFNKSDFFIQRNIFKSREDILICLITAHVFISGLVLTSWSYLTLKYGPKINIFAKLYAYLGSFIKGEKSAGPEYFIAAILIVFGIFICSISSLFFLIGFPFILTGLLIHLRRFLQKS